MIYQTTISPDNSDVDFNNVNNNRKLVVAKWS